MAIFSLFTGLIYNEAFSIPLSIFGHTSWKCPSDPSISLIDIRTNEAVCPEAYTTGLTQVRLRVPPSSLTCAVPRQTWAALMDELACALLDLCRTLSAVTGRSQHLMQNLHTNAALTCTLP